MYVFCAIESPKVFFLPRYSFVVAGDVCIVVYICISGNNPEQDVYTLEVGLLGEGAGGRVLPCVAKYYFIYQFSNHRICIFFIVVNVFICSMNAIILNQDS